MLSSTVGSQNWDLQGFREGGSNYQKGGSPDVRVQLAPSPGSDLGARYWAIPSRDLHLVPGKRCFPKTASKSSFWREAQFAWTWQNVCVCVCM